ncbi:MAG: CorA family divalent cation transporter [Anaerolineaceae bacterium]
MLRAAFILPEYPPVFLDSAQGIKEHQDLTDGYLWVSLENSSDAENYAILRDVFHFHHRSIEDCQSPGFQVAKIDDFSEYIFIITHALNFQAEDEDQTTRELDVFLGSNFVVTCYSNPQLPAVVRTLEQIRKYRRIVRFGPVFLRHTILDNFVDEYLPILGKLESELEWLEDSAIEKPTP